MYALGNFSNYTFYQALWSPEILAHSAADAGYVGIGLSDFRGFYGSVPFSQACRAHGLRPIHGCRIRVESIGTVQLTVKNPGGFRQLSAALTRWNTAMRDRGHVGNLPAGHPPVTQGALAAFWETAADGLLLSQPVVSEPGEQLSPFTAWQKRYRELGRVVGREFIWLELGWHTEEERHLQRAAYQGLSESRDRWVLQTGARLPTGESFATLEVLQSMGGLTLRGQDHPDKIPPGDYTLPTRETLRRQFDKAPGVLLSTADFAEQAQFDFALGKLFMPHHEGREADTGAPGYDRQEQDYRRLRWLCYRGLVANYHPEVYPWKGGTFQKPGRRRLQERLRRELAIVRETGYAGYFLIFHDVIEACRLRDIPVLARGSAAGSLICYCLGVSNVCPFRFGLSFERFLNHERLRHSKLPDIDLDLPWDRRDEIITYVYEKFGEAHVAMIGGFATFKARAAIAEVGKTLGRPESVVRRWTRHLPMGNLKKFARRRKHLTETRDLGEEEYFEEALQLADRFDSLPRHPMMHPCGIVIADRPLTEFTPLDPSNKGFRMTQMAMDPIEDLGLLKLDLLGQAGLSVLRDAALNIRSDRGLRPESGKPDPRAPLARINYRDSAVFQLVKTGQARGVFHIESPAMTSLLKLCRCQDIDCLVATVSVIRPGAANEDKKNLFARRYLGLDPPHYHHPDLEPILRESYGLMIYEEHIILVAHHWAGLGLGKADLLRRILIKKKEGEELERLGQEFCACARQKGYTEEEITTVWNMLVQFSGYMFNKAHGAAYAVEAYQGCLLKLHWPVHFLVAVLQNQRGFYSPLVYVLEAMRSGARFNLPRANRPIDKYWAETQPDGAVDVHLPLWQIAGLSREFLRHWQTTVTQRSLRPGQDCFADWDDFLSNLRPTPADLMLLAKVGALRTFFANRHQAVWEAARWSGRHPGANLLPIPETKLNLHSLPPEDLRQNAAWEQELLGFPVSCSPFQFWMGEPDRLGVIPIDQLDSFVGQEVDILGIIVTTRNHHTLQGKPMKFVTLADETGLCETVLFPDVYQKFGYEVSRSTALRARILVERDATQSGLSCTLMECHPLSAQPITHNHQP